MGTHKQWIIRSFSHRNKTNGSKTNFSPGCSSTPEKTKRAEFIFSCWWNTQTSGTRTQEATHCKEISVTCCNNWVIATSCENFDFFSNFSWITDIQGTVNWCSLYFASRYRRFTIIYKAIDGGLFHFASSPRRKRHIRGSIDCESVHFVSSCRWVIHKQGVFGFGTLHSTKYYAGIPHIRRIIQEFVDCWKLYHFIKYNSKVKIF